MGVISIGIMVFFSRCRFVSVVYSELRPPIVHFNSFVWGFCIRYATRFILVIGGPLVVVLSGSFWARPDHYAPFVL